jgi:hypothetical protein
MKTVITYLSILLSLLISIGFKTSNEDYSHLYLFKIQRSKDANEIYYEANIKSNNKIQTDEPINIYWIKHENKGKKETLSHLQKKYAYGLNYSEISDTEAVFKFVSYKDREFTLKRNRWGAFKVFTNSKGSEIIVSRLYLQIEGGTLWFPQITRIDIYGFHSKTNKPVVEIVHL